ncbi:MAG: lipid-A-disaccharide synthase [candidate division KSB1 bacterium]|nr:lipid-A-disaccharide synthase [candidate division KSB1 bacterium]MDZ7304970.1 lipid-A-disaccharide synthase [candidate division KSB1 bacterium]MDZ7313997.1 lipid-A-disaccharide synthase [candidate division KSB1 bacterium]
MMENRLCVLIVAGEASGDLHGAGVVRELKQLAPHAEIFGIGGDQMAAAGMELLFHIRDMAVIGFTEVLRHLRFFRHVMHTLENEVARRQPGVVLLIDYPGFNLRFAARLRNRHEAQPKILYYIAPQVWAWGARRIPKMAKLVDQMAVVFPFELPLFQSAGIPTVFVGHPLLEGLRPQLSTEIFFSRYQLHAERPLLGLLPGSRKQEIEHLLPDMLATAEILRNTISDLQVAVAMAPNLPETFYRTWVKDHEVRLIANATYEVMRDSRACLVCSGTATLETACFGTPLVVVYRVSRLSYEIARRVVKLPHIGLVNVVAGRKIVPEFVQNDFVPERVAPVLANFIKEGKPRAEVQRALAEVRTKLGTPGASRRTAELVLQIQTVSEAQQMQRTKNFMNIPV